MPKGPQGQKRPADVIGNAVRIMEIATGQREVICDVETGACHTVLAEIAAHAGDELDHVAT